MKGRVVRFRLAMPGAEPVVHETQSVLESKGSNPGVIVLGVVALLIASSIAWAQEPSRFVPGARIRIAELDSTGRRAGTVVTAGWDTIVLRPDQGEAVPIATSRITQLDVSQGRHGNALKGVAFGGLAGVGIGLVVGAATTDSNAYEGEAAINSLAWAGVFAGVGMLVGGVIGGSYKTERWEKVPTALWRLTAGPSRTGFVLALSRSLDDQTD